MIAAGRTGIVVGLDFGTSTSGLAFLHDVSLHPPAIFDRYPSQPPGNPYPKQPTALRYDISDPARPQLLAVGWEAVNWISGQRSTLLILEPKLAIDPLRNRPLAIPSCVQLTPQRVLSDFLSRMLTITQGYLESAYPNGATSIKHVRWCLTVPACWTDREKAAMRQAAVDAGLIGSVDAPSSKFCIVLEPEAAAIACLRQNALALNEGTTFMVADMGGGTVDITSHRVTRGSNQDLVLRELSRTSDPARLAELCGSGNVDKNFREWLARELGDEPVSAFYGHQCRGECTTVNRATCPILSGLRDFRRNWESTKCDARMPLGVQLLPFPAALRRLARDFDAPRLAYFVAGHGGSEEMIEISPREMEQIFRPVLIQIAELVKRQWRAGAVDMVLVVGGFAQNPLLRDAITKAVRECRGGRNCQVVFPPRPASAVLEGAAYYGRNPAVIHSRRTTRFYGIIAALPASYGDPPRHCFNSDGGRRCSQFFEFVKADQEVPVETKITHTFRPLFHGQTSMTIEVVSSDRAAKYPDDPGVQTEQTIILAMPDPTGGMNREVEVEFHFGTSEIAISTREKKEGGSSTSPRSILFCHHLG